MVPCVSTIINIHLQVKVRVTRGVENTGITEDTDVISVWLVDVLDV